VTVDVEPSETPGAARIPEDRPGGMAKRLPRIAYLVNQYPQPSQSFIRREIAALEAMGATIPRFSIRRCAVDPVDPLDVAERDRTKVVLGVGGLGLISALARTAVTRPFATWNALRLAVRLGRRSERGVAIHLVYLAEACVLAGWLRAGGIEHLHTHFGTNSAATAALASALGGPQFSMTVHGPEEFDHPWALALDEKIRGSAFAVAISQFGKSQLCRWVPYHEWSKIKIVRCGLDSMFLGDEATPPPADRRLVCVGRLAEQKGQLTLIEAAARLREEGEDFELVLAGDGPMRDEIEGLIDRFGLKDRVRLVGWQSNSQVRDLIRRSRALVLPSFAEGLPVVIMEALALGRPVISTYVAGIPELIQPGISGWLTPAGSVDDLVEAMRGALDMSVDALREMGRAGAARVAERHDAATEAARLLALINDSLRRRRPQPRPAAAEVYS
jgi:glycosyltransferase involved in cell wall biosynthesis